MVDIYSKIIIRYTDILKNNHTSSEESLGLLRMLWVVAASDSVFKKAAMESYGTVMIPAVIINLFKDSKEKNPGPLEEELENLSAECLVDICNVQSIYFKSILNSIFLYNRDF